jgi:hypothetical protein
MRNSFALAVASVLLASSAAFADTTVESSTVAPGASTSSSTTIMRDQAPAPVIAPVIVAPESPTVQKTKFKKEHRGFFGKTKVKGETTTVTP